MPLQILSLASCVNSYTYKSLVGQSVTHPSNGDRMATNLDWVRILRLHGFLMQSSNSQRHSSSEAKEQEPHLTLLSYRTQSTWLLIAIFFPMSLQYLTAGRETRISSGFISELSEGVEIKPLEALVVQLVFERLSSRKSYHKLQVMRGAAIVDPSQPIYFLFFPFIRAGAIFRYTLSLSVYSFSSMPVHTTDLKIWADG